MDNIILIEGGVILFFGIMYTIQNSKPVTPVFVGSIGLLLVVSLLEIAGGIIEEIGKALLSLATFSVVVAEGPGLLIGITNAEKKAVA